MTNTHTSTTQHDNTIPALRRFVFDCVASDQPDLSQRQLAVLLAIHIEDEPWTVRGLAAALNIHKPAITRAMDRLAELGFARRQIDPNDRRSVLLCRTLRGARFVGQLRAKMQSALAA
jgi:DNA-binding MarR family transcriptional regulator